MKTPEFILATSIKNEGLYILEWLSYYKCLGFDKFIVYSNDNTDGSDKLLKLLHESKEIEWVPQVVYEEEKPQGKAFDDLTNRYLNDDVYRDTYLAFLDMDEFLVLHEDDNIRQFVSRYKNPLGIFVNWKHFGTGNQTEYNCKLTIDRFDKCAKYTNLNKQGKMIVKLDNRYIKYFRHHFPELHDVSNVHGLLYANTDIQMVLPNMAILNDWSVCNPIIMDEAPIYHNIAQLNHYALRSQQEYELKKERGKGNSPKGPNQRSYVDKYYDDRDINDDIDSCASVKYSTLVKKYIESYSKEIMKEHNNIINTFLKKVNLEKINQ